MGFRNHFIIFNNDCSNWNFIKIRGFFRFFRDFIGVLHQRVDRRFVFLRGFQKQFAFDGNAERVEFLVFLFGELFSDRFEFLVVRFGRVHERLNTQLIDRLFEID